MVKYKKIFNKHNQQDLKINHKKLAYNILDLDALNNLNHYKTQKE